MSASGPFHSQGGAIAVNPVKAVDCRVELPGSKSLTNRFLLLAGLSPGVSELRHTLESDDTRYMRQVLTQLGVTVSATGETWRVRGRYPWRAPSGPLFVGNAGTAMRFLTPALALHPMTTEIMGNERMHVRPIRDLVDGLCQAGADVRYLGREGNPPLRITGPMQAGSFQIQGEASSQYLSGLLMALPLLEGKSSLRVTGPLVSRTYVSMTLDCMRRFGVNVEADQDLAQFQIAGGHRYQPTELDVEPDASTASYWFALPLMVGGSVTVTGVPQTSTQGDYGLLELLEKMGAKVERTHVGVQISAENLTGIEADMNTMSDVAPTLAVIAVKARTPTHIRNVGNMRIKECDRIATLQRAFDRLGLTMTSGPDWMRISPGTPTRAALLDPEEDHRMAMVFTLLGLAFGGVRIKDPDCVAKTYPHFYRDLAEALHASPDRFQQEG